MTDPTSISIFEYEKEAVSEFSIAPPTLHEQLRANSFADIRAAAFGQNLPRAMPYVSFDRFSQIASPNFVHKQYVVVCIIFLCIFAQVSSSSAVHVNVALQPEEARRESKPPPNFNKRRKRQSVSAECFSPSDAKMTNPILPKVRAVQVDDNRFESVVDDNRVDDNRVDPVFESACVSTS